MQFTATDEGAEFKGRLHLPGPCRAVSEQGVEVTCQELFRSCLFLAMWESDSPLFGSLPRRDLEGVANSIESKATLPLSFFSVEIQ